MLVPLADGFGRRIVYLRLSVTDRCDLRCRYCIPHGFCDFAARDDLLSAGEVERVVQAFASLGVRRVRLTGGEPLTRRDLEDIARRVAAVSGVEDVSLSTNGTLLAKCAAALRQAGVSRLNVSLDSLRPERFRDITGRDALQAVLDGLEAARAAGYRLIKVNTVVLPDTTDEEIDALVEYCRKRAFVLRLIEPMPVGDSGRAAGWRDVQPIAARLAQRHALVPGIVSGAGPARYFVAPGATFAVGFITPLSQHFCATCNRVRVTANGKLLLCLGNDDALDLRRLLRFGATPAALREAIWSAIRSKPWMHEFHAAPGKLARIMAQTGG